MAINVSKKLHRLVQKLSFRTSHQHRSISSMQKSSDNKVKNDQQHTVRRGYVPVYVGKEHERYLVPVGTMNSTAFRAFLDEYEEEFDPSSPLSVPCSKEAINFAICLARSKQQ